MSDNLLTSKCGPEIAPHCTVFTRNHHVEGRMSCFPQPTLDSRSSVAAIVSEIACIDFPDNWTGLFDQLLSMMGTGEPNQVHGVMKVLSELASDITDSQVI